MRGVLGSMIIAGALVCGDAYAEAPLGFYLGGGVGVANVSVESNDGDCCYYYDDYDDYEDGEEDTGFAAHVGFRFNRYVAAELGYLDAGTPEWNEAYVYVPELRDVFDTWVDLEMQAAELSVLGILPFAGVWEGYVRGGAAYWWADADQQLWRVFDGARFSRVYDDEGTGFLFGIGVGVSPMPAWHIRLEFQSFTIDEDLLVTDGDSTLDTFLLETQIRLGG
jgi:opacity protein-like surface antigen